MTTYLVLAAAGDTLFLVPPVLPFNNVTVSLCSWTDGCKQPWLILQVIQSCTDKNTFTSIKIPNRLGVQGVSKKIIFGIFSLRLSHFVWNFANLLAIHIHCISTNFCRVILIFHQMVLIFPRVPIVFTLSSVGHSPITWKCSVPAFLKWCHFFVIACLSVQ